MFWADDGLDTGPILLQRECDVEPNDTVNTIYKRFLFPEGVKGTVGLTLCVCVCLCAHAYKRQQQCFCSRVSKFNFNLPLCGCRGYCRSPDRRDSLVLALHKVLTLFNYRK